MAPDEGRQPDSSSPASLGTYIRSMNEKAVETLTAIQSEYAALADHFDAVPKKQLSLHCQETLEHISVYIRARNEALLHADTQVSLPPTKGANKTASEDNMTDSSTRELSTSKFATPNPRPSDADESATPSWAAVAKKAPTRTPSPPNLSRGGQPSTFRQKPATVNLPDFRIMIRLPIDSTAFKRPTSVLLARAKNAAGGDLAQHIKTVQIVPSGLAIVRFDKQAKERLLLATDKLKHDFNAHVVEEQLPRDRFYIAYAPALTWTYETGSTVLTGNDYVRELEAGTGVRPLSVNAIGREGMESGTILATFPANQVHSGARVTLFGCCLTLKKAEDKVKIHQCNECWHFHRAQGCSRPARCEMCGDSNHSSADHCDKASKEPRI